MKLNVVCSAILLLAGSLLAISSNAQASVRLRIVDLEKQILEVEYRVEITTTANDSKKYFVFPEEGFFFADSSLTVNHVRNFETGEDMRWSLVPSKKDPNSQMLQISYQLPTVREMTKKITVDLAVEAPTKDIVIGEDSSVTVKYETSHDASFVIPGGYKVVWSSKPVLFGEDDYGLNIRVKGGERNRLSFTIRECK